ncbi:hypothetical protein Q1695_004731 [Nippostrongylus brasiliensis]|nr:hypothetical protein Q1695_004731 [Nippostrongylus brasiliensis]
MLLVGLIFSGLLGNVIAGGSTTNYKGSWQWPVRFPPYPCVVLNAQIDLYVTYTDTSGKEVDKTIHVLPTSKVDEDQSTCGKFIYIQGHPIYSQVLQINLDGYSGWSVTFTFTNDKRLKAEGEFALYQVSITADYPATKTLFPNGPDTVYNYVQPVDLNNLPSVAETVYAHLNKSLSCTSEMKFIINDDAKQGPLASFKFTNLQVEAFKVSAPTPTSKFDSSEICPRDQHATDMVPVIVGSCLAGLIVITMITYLIYRSQLPAEVLHLTNVESNSASHKGSIESDEVEVEKY